MLSEKGKERMNKQNPLLVGALLGLSLASNNLLSQTSTITDLKTLGGTAITGMALNNAGQVAGYYLRQTGASVMNVSLSLYILDHIHKSDYAR